MLLENGYSKVHYFELMRYELVLLMFFNGRRPGETERTRVQNFLHRQKPDLDDDFFKVLNPTAKKQAT